jgi:hypothetical protein
MGDLPAAVGRIEMKDEDLAHGHEVDAHHARPA